MLSLCVCEVSVGVCVEGRRRRRSRPGIQNQKQEPHTKLWGIIFGMRCWWFLLRFLFVCLCFFLLGMLHLGYACLISSSCGGMERVQTQFFMTESAGTAQGVDVALPWGHGAYANPIFDNIRTIFCRIGLQSMWHSFASVGLVLARCWALLGHIAECTAPRWVVSAPSSPMLGRCWSCWAMLGQRWDRIALILSYFGPRWSKDTGIWELPKIA